MRVLTNIFWSFSLLLLVLSCNKEEQVAGASKQIEISAGALESKSLIENLAGLKAASPVLKIYDARYLNGAFSAMQMNGVQLSWNAGTSAWEFEGGVDRSWIPSSAISSRPVHKFFGWLCQYNDGTAYEMPSTPSEGANGTRILKYGSGFNMDLTPAKQLDFLYSDIVSRDTGTSDYSTVDIPLKHLFASFGIRARNYDSAPITIKSIKLYGIKNHKEATLTFDPSAGNTTVSYENPSSTFVGDGNGLELITSSITVASNSVSEDMKYYLMWPQEQSELVYSGGLPVNASGDVTTEGLDYSKPFLLVTYGAGGEEVTVPVSLFPPDAADDWCWKAGSRHRMELAFRGKKIEMNFGVLPWDCVEEEIEYGNTVTVNPDLTFEDCSMDGGKDITDENGVKIGTSYRVYFKTGKPITCSFNISKPKNATWMIEKRNAFDAFEVDNDTDGQSVRDGEDLNYGVIDGRLQDQKIKIYPTDVVENRTYELELSFSIRLSNGDVVNVDDQIYKSSDGEEVRKYVIVYKS